MVAGQESPHLLPLYQKFLKIENYRLRLRHQAGGGGREVCASRASLIDVLLRHIFSSASASAREKKEQKSFRSAWSHWAATVAGNSIRRATLTSCFSIHERQRDAASLAQTVEQILYFLWDIGFKVGHSTRTVREAVAQANGEMVTKTAMLEARLSHR